MVDVQQIFNWLTPLTMNGGALLVAGGMLRLRAARRQGVYGHEGRQAIGLGVMFILCMPIVWLTLAVVSPQDLSSALPSISLSSVSLPDVGLASGAAAIIGLGAEGVAARRDRYALQIVTGNAAEEPDSSGWASAETRHDAVLEAYGDGRCTRPSATDRHHRLRDRCPGPRSGGSPRRTRRW